jgi:hypothetical protein
LLTSRNLLAAVLILCGHLALGYAQNYRLGANDDRLWLYHTGAQLNRGAESAPLDAHVSASLPRSDASPNKIWRYESRERYRTNYIAATTAYRAVAEIVRRWTGDLVVRDYPAFLARAMYSGFVAVYVVACACFVALVAARDRRLLVTVVATVATLALFETTFDWFGDTWSGLPVLLPEAQTDDTFWRRFGKNFPGLLLNPEVQMSPFGDTPRNHFVLMALAVFALRWRGASTASYALLLALSFLHQSQTGLLTAYVVATDALLRPRIFRSIAGALVVLTLATYVSRETLGDVIGLARPSVLAALIAAGAAVAAALWLGLQTHAAGRAAASLADWRHRVMARGDIAADLLVIALLWVTTFPIAAVINSIGTERQSIYFWSQLHGRSLGILRPAFVLGLLAWAVAGASRTWSPAPVTRAVLVLSAAALVPSAALAATYGRQPIATLEQSLREMDRSLGPGVDWTTAGSLSEEQIYYALARALDQGSAAPP